jgi:hypothetical protein
MPYISKRERERQKWMTLKEAISRIREFEGCDEAAALAQLRAALADGEIETRYAFDASSELFPIPISLAKASLDDEDVEAFWKKVPIELDDDGSISSIYLATLHEERRKWRARKRYVLFLSRGAILKHWADVDAPKQRPVASKDEIRKALVEIYRNADEKSRKPPNINEAYGLVADKLEPKRAPRKLVRGILDEPVFKERRLERGRRRLR